MTRVLRYALVLPALLCCAAHAQIDDRCKLTTDMDYLLVETFTRSDENWTETRVVDPEWKVGRHLWPPEIADHVSLQEGKEWFQLPDETPVYCEVNIRQTYRSSPGTTDQIDLYVFSLPKDRWWGDQRNQGVEGYLREVDQDHQHENVNASVSIRVNPAAHSWLTDHYARLEREIEELEALLAEAESVPETTAADGEGYYLAVATSPPPNSRIEPGESGYFGIGWHSESQYDAGMIATAECQKRGGGATCGYTANGTSLRGGCVGVALARWRDQGKDPERAYVVASSSFRDLIARDLVGNCESTAFGGKYRETVVEQSCEVLRVICAEDI